MSLRSSLYEYWTAQSGITSVVSTRIYPDVAPTSAVLPYAVFQVISEARQPHMTAASGLIARRVQVACYGATPDSATTAAEAFRAEMDGFKTAGMGTGGNVTQIRRVLLDGGDTGMEQAQDASQAHKFYHRQDYIVWHTESVPTF